MDRNFFLPIAVAAGVHSLLFLSGTPSPRTPDVPTKADTKSWAVDVTEIEPPEPPTTEGEPGKHSDAPPPPTGIENLTTQPRAEDFIQPAKLEDLRPRTGTDVGTIDPHWQEALGGGTNSNGPIGVVFLDNKPMARFQPAPIYPQDLKPVGDDGNATVTFSVDVNGEVFNATVTRSSHSRFGEEALRAVKRWRFEPGLKNGKRVAFRMVQTFSFTLSE